MAGSKKKTQSTNSTKRTAQSSSEEDPDSGEEGSPVKHRNPWKRQKKQATEEEEEEDKDELGKKGTEGTNEILRSQHDISIPNEVNIKQEAADVNLIFSELEEVCFTTNGSSTTEKGRWCNVCREDAKVVAKKGLRKCFISGGTLSCCTHIRTHYSEYTERCKKAGISEHHWALPRKLVKEQEQLQKREEGTIEAMGFKPKPGHTTLEPFSKELVLKYIAKFVVCTDQPFAIAGNLYFRNALVAMRPNTKSSHLPSVHQITDFLHNEFTRTMNERKVEIEGLIGLVSICEDLWSSPSNKMPFMGTVGSYIVVKQRKNQRPSWTLKSAVLAFHAVEGAHDGDNLGQYLFGICRHIGIIDTGKKMSKLGNATLDNATNNQTTCEKIEDLHVCLDLIKWDATENQLMCLSHVLDTRHTNDNCASSVAACSSPVGVEDDNDDPATSFAKYCAEQAAKAKRSGHSG